MDHAPGTTPTKTAQTAHIPPSFTPHGSNRESGARSVTTTLHVSGMDCGNCVQKVQKALQGVDGVDFATVDLGKKQATVRWLLPSENPDVSALTEAIAKAGYEAKPFVNSSQDGKPIATADSDSSNPWQGPLLLGVPVTVILLTLDWGVHLGNDPRFHWFAFFLALPVQVWLGGRFYRGAWRQLKSGGSNMDTLVSLGSTAAFGFSVGALLMGWAGHLYFAEAATILTLISLGHWMEARMSSRAAQALRSLLELQPATARKLHSDEQWDDVPVEDLIPGDHILIRPGDRIPVDATLLGGEGTVDESMLTGESLPVEKLPGQSLYTGTLNRSGRFEARVDVCGAGTALDQIIQAVQRAQGSRANIQRLVDRISNVFVPIVIGIALVSGLIWGLVPGWVRPLHTWLTERLWVTEIPSNPLAAAVVVACAVLIVACPCAMGLATPVALMAGVNVGARRGILIRDAVALEKSGRIQTLAFDKTGTLTRGEATVHQVLFADESVEQQGAVRELAAQVTNPSLHPLSRAIGLWAQNLEDSPANPLPQPVAVEAVSDTLTNWSEVRGQGVEGVLNRRINGVPMGARLRLGSLNWFRELNGTNPKLETWAATQANSGATVLLLWINSDWHAAFSVRDEPRPDAAEVIRVLRAQGLAIRLITGDTRATALAVAREVGIAPEEVLAEVRPEEKAGQIRLLRNADLHRAGSDNGQQPMQQTGGRAQGGGSVAFVGDGLNDGPALAEADLGICVVQATEVAKEASDILLLHGGLSAVPEALNLARATLRTIHQNLFWAFFYNAAAIPLAALGLLSPVVCALTMGLSDIIVVGNALRLRRFGK